MENETDLLFREMQPGDKAQMTAFYAALGKESTAFFNVGRGNENRTMDFFSGGRPFHKFYVAETGGVVAGHLFIWDTDCRIPWLGVAVRDDYRGRHIGQFMLRSVEALLAGQGYGGLLLRTAQQNIAARRLYEKCGYTHVGTHPSGELLYLRRFPTEAAI